MSKPRIEIAISGPDAELIESITIYFKGWQGDPEEKILRTEDVLKEDYEDDL